MKSGVSLRIPLKNMALTMYYVQEKMEEKVDFCRSGASEASERTTLNTETVKRFSDWDLVGYE